MGIAHELRIVEWLRRDERVVLGSDDERGKRNAIDDAERAGAMVVVRGAPEAEVRRGVHVVEVADGSYGRQPFEIEEAWTDTLLSANAPLEIPHEIPLVERVARTLQRPHALADLDDGRHGGDGAKCPRRMRPVFGGELQRDVAAERITRDPDRGQSIHLA